MGRFNDPVARELLDPAELEVVDLVRAGLAPSGDARRIGYEMVRHTGQGMVPRTIAIDDAIRDHAARQVVVLGAGLDSRAWRMPELAGATVFELDHPASQRDKRRRVGDRTPLAGRVVWVPADLARERLEDALGQTGFDRHAATTWVWEGVVPYLSPAAVRATTAALSTLSAPGSRLVVNYQDRSLSASVLRVVMRLVLRLARQPDPMAGERWRSLWSPSQIRTMLGDNDFEVTHDADLLTLTSGLDVPTDNVASFRNGRVAVAVRRNS